MTVSAQETGRNRILLVALLGGIQRCLAMLPPLLNRLVIANAGMHAADQIALVALPLAAVTLFSASPALVGALVAAQGMAWLIVSLPGGIVVDRLGPSRLARLAPWLSLAGLTLALLALRLASPYLLGLAVFISATGTVLFVLALATLTPRLLPPTAFAKANGRLELARALVTLPAPTVIAWLIAHVSTNAAFIAALAAAAMAIIALSSMPRPPPSAQPPRHPIQDIREGLLFVWHQPILRGILGCALAWNAAFFALVAVFVPFALNIAQLSVQDIGLALSGQGVGLLLGALTAGTIVTRFQPRFILILGPLSSVAGAALIFISAGQSAIYTAGAGYFLVGFCPMLWLVCQTSLRQSVTPAALLGRVNATIQLAIYGVRPLGALLGGAIAHRFGPGAALILVIALFALSTIAAIVSDLGRLRTMPAAATEPLV